MKQLFGRTLSASRRMAGLVVLLLLLFYVYQQVFSRENGIGAWFALRGEVAQLKQDNAALQAQVGFQEQRVERLYRNSLDTDYIDELSRRELGWGKAEEVIIFIPSEQ